MDNKSMKNRFFSFFYKRLLKPFFFRRDPEAVHDRITQVGIFLGKYSLTRWLTKRAFFYAHSALEQTILGIRFANPVGLSAGFDKDARLTDILPSLGFGFAEVGSVTGEPCLGNPKPRLWRLPKSQSLVVYYGLKNLGCQAIAQNLQGKRFAIPVGISVAKTNSPATVATVAGVEDYLKAYKAFRSLGSYTTVNISCPNAYGGEPFTDPAKLEKLLSAIDAVADEKPIFLKLSPDLTYAEIDAILEVMGRHKVQGVICSNLTKNRNNPSIKDEFVPEKGGLSGKVEETLANEAIRYVYKKTKDRYVIIGCGGVFTAQDAYAKIKAGARLIQLITGMVFLGPQTISEINRGLVRLLALDGFDNIAQAVGADNR